MFNRDDDTQAGPARALPEFKGKTDSGVPFKAPDGEFRVIGVDTFDNDDWHEGDFDSLQLALDHVAERTEGQEMLKMHIYDDQGNHVGEGGSF